MNRQEAVDATVQVLDEERIHPTAEYQLRSDRRTADMSSMLDLERKRSPRPVRDNPAEVQFTSDNFTLLSVIAEQVSDQDRPRFLSILTSRIADGSSYHHVYKGQYPGSTSNCSSELPLVAEFMVRRGYKRDFFAALGAAALGPGLTLMLEELEDMIAFNFTLFTAAEYEYIRMELTKVRASLFELEKRPRPSETKQANIVYCLVREVPPLCMSIIEVSRKARFLYVKGSLSQGVNLEVNEDKNKVQKNLERMGFSQHLIECLDEVDRLYNTSSTLFDLKSSMGHLRSFIEQMYLQTCTRVHVKYGGTLPRSWGSALSYLHSNGMLTKREEEFTSSLYSLISDIGVHPLVSQREYVRLMRNIGIEYGLLFLTKLEKLGLP